MIHVVEAISDTNIGGAGVLLLNRLDYMEKDLFRTTVILPKNSLLEGKIRKKGIEVYPIDGCYNKSFDVESLPKYVRALKELKPDIVNSHGCMNARLASRIVGVKTSIFTRHCDFPLKELYKNKFVKMIIGKMNLLLNDGIIAVSESAKRNLTDLGVKENEITVIVNGSRKLNEMNGEEKLAVRKKLNIPKEVKIISIFARLEYYKDHRTLLAASQYLAAGKFRILIVGTGSIADELQQYAKNIGVDDRVSFLGFKEDITEIMNVTDINVNCSIGTETSSLALSEGMSIGVPAIASDYAGNLYMVRNFENGIIFKQGDYFELAEKIKMLAQNSELYEKLSQNARKRFLEELNAKSMSEKTQDYYKKLYNKTHRNM